MVLTRGDNRMTKQKVYKEIDRFYIDDVDVIVGDDGDNVVLLVEGHDLPPNNRFGKWVCRKGLESFAYALVRREKLRGL